MENVIVAYTNSNSDMEYTFGMLALLGPFVATLQVESDIYFCFSALMKKIGMLLCHVFFVFCQFIIRAELISRQHNKEGVQIHDVF